MAEIRTKSEEREYRRRLIADWNASRLDIFAISEPTEDLEYRGVMRFFFQDSGSKVATKCVRFTNRDNTQEVTKVLVEKFHPDMKMLSNPTYSLYEVHPNGDARKLRMDEYPLQIQLEWQLGDREGRFLLKSDSDKIVHSNLFDVKSSDKAVPQEGTAVQNLKRRLSKREKKQLKKQREEAKKAAEKSGKDDNQIAQHLYDELPETSFTRSISNPEAVMRRRRQQKLEKRLKDFQSKDSPAGGTLKIFANTLKPEIPYKTLLVSVDDTTTHVIKEALIKYQMEKEDPEEYCLVMVNIPAEGTNTSATLGKERVVHDDDCPLKIAVTWPSNRGTVVFHLRRRANLPQHRRDKRRSKSPVRKPMDLSPDKTVAERLANAAYPDHLLPYLLELSSDGNDLDYKPRMHRLQMIATEVGSEKTFASGGNYLHLYAPHILPRHCVITNMDGRVSVTPSSGDAEVLVNGKRIYETTQLQHGDVVKIGRSHTFRFCDPAYEPQRHSAPVYGDNGSISSNSDIDVQRKPRPQSLGSALPSHHSNSYHNNHIDDNVDVDTDEHPEGMFETTFDVSGEVLTYTGGQRETEPYTYSKPPDSPIKRSFSNEDIYDDKLPATLEFRENGEDAFFAAVISEVNGLAVHFKLAPTYTLYMCSRYRLSPHYRSDLMEHQRGERLGVTILKIANMARSTIRENADMPGSLAFWMANCSEFLHFIKQDVDISPYTKDGQQVLAQSVQLAFRHLVLCVQHELRTSMSAFLDPTDEADMEESDLDSMNDSDNDHVGMPADGRSFRVQNKYGQDGRPLSGADSWFGGRRVLARATVSEVIYNLTSTMSLLRRCRVNAALTIQVFSQLFHFINMWLFNKLVLEPKLDLCTREWGRRISKRLARVEKWAEKQGLELAADCHLCRIAQAAHLLQAPKNSSADINAISSSCFKLNSLQIKTLLENYRPAPDEYLSQDHIELLVATAEEKADEVARSNGQEIQREEETELQLPFLLPEDGYSCDVIRGVPPGLQGFLEPLANTGLCRLTIQPETSGLWTVYQRKHMESSVDVPATITPDIQDVSFNKGRGGMGLSIVAAKGIRQDKLGIYIKQVVKDGPASKDGRLQAGDQILSVNGESLVGVTQERAAEVMVKSGSIVTLKIVKQGAIYHGLATMLIQQSPNRETAPAPRKLTPVEPEPEPMQLSPTLPENDIRSSGRWLSDSYANESARQLEDEESMRDKSWRQKEEESRRGKEEQERMFEERRRREDEERMRRENEERMRREAEEDRIRQEEEDRIREEEEERMRSEEEERIRREEEDRLYEERLKKEEEEKRLYEERRRKEEEDKRALRIRQEKQEEERRRREEEEDEKFRVQEEWIRKRMEEERRIIEEERRKLAEERRLLEEERKKEDERKRTEKQRLVEEERRLAEEKQMIEEERKRVLSQKKAEEETRRLQEEQRALMAQRRLVEEEREMAEQRRHEEMEEQRRHEEMEELRRREEMRKREEYRRMEDQRRLAEERRRSEEEERLRPMENKQRTRKIRFEDEVIAAENAPKVETVQQSRSSPQPIETKPEKEIFKPKLKATVEAEKPEITPISKKPKDEYYEEEPVVIRGKLSEEDMSTMDAAFERLDEESKDVRPSSLNIPRPGNKQPIAEEPPTSPIRVDSRDTRYGRAIVIKQGMLPTARPTSSQNKTNFDYESVAQNLKSIDQNRRQKQDVNNEDEFERWQKRQREVAEQREREAEERNRLGREQEETRQREQRDREQREREQREREQREREQREREQREREQREREQREREQREREQRELEQREREQREREKREREQREREELERQRLERERLERERKEYLEQQRKEQEEREKSELEKKRSVEENKKQEAEEKRRVIEIERKMLSSTSKGSKETLDYIEAMNEEEVEREFQRRLEADRKRRSLDRTHEDRRAGGLVSVTRVTYHPERDDQSERDRKLQMIIQERKELERERKESDRRVVFEGEREKQKEMQRRQQEENERQQEDWLRQQREKHEQARREQGRLRMDRKSQEDEDIMKKRSELQQKREQEDVVRMNIQRIREEAERKMEEEHKQQRLEQERELQRKLEEQKILIEKEGEARRQLQEEQRMRSARGSTGEPDHVIELKERALKDYERRRMLIDQEINRQRVEGRYQEQLRQTAMEEVKTKFDQQPKPVSVLKTSNGTKPKKQVSFSNLSTEFHEPASPTYVVESPSGYTAKITPAASVRLVQTRPPADLDSPPIPRPPPPDDDDYDDYDPPPLPPPPPPEELLDDDQFPPPPRTLFNDRSSSSSSMSSSDPRSPVDHNSRDYSDVFPADYPYPPNSHQFKNTVSSYGTYPRAARPVSYPTPADLDNLQFNDSVRYGGSNNNISGFNSSSGIRETQSLGRITSTDSSAFEANRVRMERISLTDDTRKEPPPVAKKPEKLGFKEKMKMFNDDGTPKSRVTVSRWERQQMDVNGDVSYT